MFSYDSKQEKVVEFSMFCEAYYKLAEERFKYSIEKMLFDDIEVRRAYEHERNMRLLKELVKTKGEYYE